MCDTHHISRVLADVHSGFLRVPHLLHYVVSNVHSPSCEGCIYDNHSTQEGHKKGDPLSANDLSTTGGNRTLWEEGREGECMTISLRFMGCHSGEYILWSHICKQQR